MNSNALLAAVLAFTFFVFITTKGQLLDYLGTIGLGPRANEWKSKSPSSGQGSNSGGVISDVASAFAHAEAIGQSAEMFATAFGV